MYELSTLPRYDANRFYRKIAELAEKYFEEPENKKRFEEWRRECEEKAQKEKAHKEQDEPAALMHN